MTVLQYTAFDMPAPTLDALRYVDYALNIHDHGVFGLSGADRANAPAPGNANSPLYPALLAAVVAADPGLHDALTCALGDAPGACPQRFATLVFVQSVIALAALACVWLTAFIVFRHRALAWTAAALVLASTKLQFFANQILTEILVLFFYAALILCLALAVRSRRRRSWIALGAVLGALTLTRPEYHYLALAFAAFAVAAAFARGARTWLPAVAAAVVAYGLVVGPWLLRNHHEFGEAAITGGYGDVIFAYRAAYNRMTLPEWGAAFIAWLPGHGETLAQALLPPATWARLGTDADDYLYVESREIFDAGLAAVGGERERLMGYLIRTEILEHPFRHAFASIPLAWRGILAGKYLAVLGVPALLALGVLAVRRRWRVTLALMLPAFVMVALYATVSVSIPRYNVYLIYYYAIAVAWACVSLVDRRWVGESTASAGRQ